MQYALEKAKKQAREIVKKALKIKTETLEVELPKEIADVALPLFKLAKSINKNPSELAKEAEKNIKEKNLLDGSVFSDVRAVNGYLNFYFNYTKFGKLVFDDIKRLKEKYGSSARKNKTVVIDYSSPNIARPFSVGHLRSTIIGNSLYRIYKFLGYKVIGDNHLGDYGTQFGKLICAYKKWGKKEKIRKEPIKELLRLYVKFHKEAEKNSSLEEEARKWFKKLEQNDKEAVKLWKWFRELSLEEFNKIYKMLDVKFDFVLGESFYKNKLKSIVKEALAKGVAEWAESKTETFESSSEEKIGKKEKVVLVRLEKYGIETPLLLQKSDGTSLYATRDLATAKYRIERWKPEMILYVVGNEQKLYFKQVFKALELLGYKTKYVHVSFGLVLLKGKKVSTRKGRIIFLEDVLKEAIKKAKELVSEKIKNKEKIAKIVGIGAVKYNDLSQDRTKDIEFDWKKMLNLKGNSAPYIQYSYVRARSILNKIGKIKKVKPELLKEEEEKQLIKKLSLFPNVISKAAESFQPYFIANYLFDLAKLFNNFYEKFPVLKAEKRLRESRAFLVYAIAVVIKTGLSLLGIDCPDEM